MILRLTYTIHVDIAEFVELPVLPLPSIRILSFQYSPSPDQSIWIFIWTDDALDLVLSKKENNVGVDEQLGFENPTYLPLLLYNMHCIDVVHAFVSSHRSRTTRSLHRPWKYCHPSSNVFSKVQRNEGLVRGTENAGALPKKWYLISIVVFKVLRIQNYLGRRYVLNSPNLRVLEKHEPWSS